LVFRYLAGKLKSEEIKIWKKMDAIFCITKQLEKSLVSFVSLKTKVLTFFVNNTLSSKKNTEKNHLSYFHIGAMDWKPNKEGVDWFVHEVWNSIYSSSPLHLAGKASEKNLFPNKNIEEHGFVPDANEFIQSHDVMIVPLLQGSGMRIKIIEAMALGKCVISTSIGAEGIAATPNKNILIANTADEFKQAIDFLNTNPSKAYEMGESARELVEERYSAQALEKEILPFINSILNLEK
jgi:glycosyltransferase involved in cell wall biosynthesis